MTEAAAIHCAGCGKSQDKAEFMVDLRNQTGICDECVDSAGAIVDEHRTTAACLAAYREAQRANPASFSDETFVARILAVIRAERSITTRRLMSAARLQADR